jgi:hypothetical protein
MVIPVTATIAAGRRRRRETHLPSKRHDRSERSINRDLFRDVKNTASNLRKERAMREEALNQVNHLLRESLKRFA